MHMPAVKGKSKLYFRNQNVKSRQKVFNIRVWKTIISGQETTEVHNQISNWVSICTDAHEGGKEREGIYN